MGETVVKEVVHAPEDSVESVRRSRLLEESESAIYKAFGCRRPLFPICTVEGEPIYLGHSVLPTDDRGVISLSRAWGD